MIISSRLMTVGDVALRLSISKATAYELIKRGKLKCYRIGGRRGAIRVGEEDLQAYLQACVIGVRQEPQRLKSIELKHIRLR